MRTIKEFPDKSKFLLGKGERTPYLIYYQNNGNVPCTISQEYLLKGIKKLMVDNQNDINQMRKAFRKGIYDIPDLESSSIEKLEEVIKHYNFKGFDLWTKVAYMTLLMYYTEDNIPHTILWRSLTRH